MLSDYSRSKDYYWVVVIVSAEKGAKIVAAATRLGIERIFVAEGRGVFHKRKIGFIPIPSISPMYDILHVLVPKTALSLAMNTFIQEGQLSHFGSGSIYATRLQDVWHFGTTLYSGERQSATPPLAPEIQSDLVAINCVCQLGHAEEIAHSAMLAGSASPTVSFGYGHGIRDRLNFFLQLTINPKKECIELVVGQAEAERIFGVMVASGHLDRPAQGFISMRPVELGLVNMVSYHHQSTYPATMEQIIKAIDQLQGNTKWRSSGTIKTPLVPNGKIMRNLVSLNCVVNRGFGDICSMKAMEAGASGTSTCYVNAVPVPKHMNRLDGSDEREIISLTIAPDQVETVAAALAAMPELDNSPVILYANPAPQALTYLK